MAPRYDEACDQPGRDRIPEVQRERPLRPLQSATLRVFANSGLRWGFDAYSTPNTSWAESSLTYNNAPALGTKLGSFPSGTLTGWIQLNVTPAVTGNGTYSFALVGTYWMEITLASRESGANAPQLVLTTAGTPDTPPSPPSNLAVNNPTTTTLPLPGPPQPTTSPSPATTSSSTAANSPPPPPPTTPSPTSPATPPTPSQSTHTTQPETHPPPPPPRPQRRTVRIRPHRLRRQSRHWAQPRPRSH